MAVKTIDKEINKYLPLLGIEEKKSLLVVIRSFLNLKKEENVRISIKQYNKEIDVALAQISKGDYLTQEEFEKEMEKW